MNEITMHFAKIVFNCGWFRTTPYPQKKRVREDISIYIDMIYTHPMKFADRTTDILSNLLLSR